MSRDALPIETQQLIELGYMRAHMVNMRLSVKLNRWPDASDAQIDEWEKNFYRQWRETYPALALMFPSAIGADLPGEPA